MDSEITIIGAGPAGLTAAIFLAQHNIPVRVFEKSIFPRDKVCGDCLGGFAVSVLGQMGENILFDFEKLETLKVGGGVHFFGPDNQKVSFKATNYVTDKLKEVALIKRIDFDYFLYNTAKKYKEITFNNDEISSLIQKAGRIELINSKNQTVGSTSRLVLATGSKNKLIGQLMERKIPRKKMAAGLRAYYKNVSLPDNNAFIELHFLKNIAPGYFWIFPLPDNQVNVGLGIRSDIITKNKINIKHELNNLIEKQPYLKERFKDAELISNPVGYPLFLGGSRQNISGENFILSGDAAYLIEPLFGEGIGHAMYSGLYAAEHIKNSMVDNRFDASYNKSYDNMVYDKLGSTLKFSALMQHLSFYPSLMSFLFNRLKKSDTTSNLMFGLINGQIPKTRMNGLRFLLNIITPF